MAATLGLRSVVMLVGAGYTGSFFYNNVDIDRARLLAANYLLSTRPATGGTNDPGPASNGSSASGAGDSAVAALTAQVDRLTTEVARRADPGSSVVVLPPSAATGYRGVMSTLSDAFNLLGWAVVGVSVSGAVYYIAVRKRVALRDLAWVSTGTFNGTVNALKQGLQRVNNVVTAVSAELADRLGRVESRVENVHDSLKAELSEQVGRVTQGVSELSHDVAALGEGVEETRRQISAVDGKIDFSNQGIALLVQAVAKMHPDLLRNDTAYELLSRAPGLSSEVRLAIESVSPASTRAAQQAAAAAQAKDAAHTKGAAPGEHDDDDAKPGRRASARMSNGGLSFLLGGGAQPAPETVDARAKATDKKGGNTRSFDAWGLAR